MSDAPLRDEGSREALVALLHERAEARWHWGQDGKAKAALAGAAELEAGASSVRVGPRRYVVTGET